jgi:hypothetical protein
MAYTSKPVYRSSDDLSLTGSFTAATELLPAQPLLLGTDAITNNKMAYYGLRVRKTAGGASTDTFRVYRGGTAAAPTNLCHEFDVTWTGNDEEAYDQIGIPAPLDGALLVTGESTVGAPTTHTFTVNADLQGIA